MKNYTKRARKFLNRPSTGCMAGVSWYVSVADHYTSKKRKVIDAGIQLNREALSHYIMERKDMRALYTMRDELHRFIMECEQAFDAIEAHNKEVDSEQASDEDSVS